MKGDWIQQLKTLRKQGKIEEAEQVRRDAIIQIANIAEEMGQTWTADRLRRRAAGEIIVDRRECLYCGLYFEPTGPKNTLCSKECKMLQNKEMQCEWHISKKACAV